MLEISTSSPAAVTARQPWLGTTLARDLFLRILEQTRKRYRFVVLGYVIMPEHVQLLMREPQIGNPSKVMQVVKQRFAQQTVDTIAEEKDEGARVVVETSPKHVWQARFFDFNVWTERKRIEKLRYIHRNPVKRGLVDSPGTMAME